LRRDRCSWTSATGVLRNVKIVYLDQNKWIDLARAVKSPKAHPVLRELLEAICEKIKTDELLFPLSASNLYETYKINRAEQRFDLAMTQVALSQALVYRGLHRRLETEVGAVLAHLYGLPWSDLEPRWFLSDVFFEATVDQNDPRLGVVVPPRIVDFIQSDPEAALLDYLVSASDAERIEAVRRFSNGCDELRLRIEDRRARHGDQPMSMRRKIYSVLMAIEQQDVIIAIAERLGLPWTCLGDKGGAILREIIRETPAFFIEREISLKLEAQGRPIANNDMQDMRSFCTVLPYADLVIAENQFTNLAKQAGLDKRYGTQLETDILCLREIL